MDDRKQRLIEILDAFQEKQEWIWSLLDDHQLSRQGTVDDWAPKDHLAHADFWAGKVLYKLQIAVGSHPREGLERYEKTNEETYAEFKDRSWDEMLLYSRDLHRQMIDTLSSIPTDLLEDPERFAWTNHRPLWHEVVFSALYHRIQHACDMLKLSGLGHHGRAIQEEFSRLTEDLDTSTRWIGITRYNLACYYALNGDADAALECLVQAFKIHPDLLEWSRQDTDLDGLRQLPAFISMTR